MSRSGPPGHSGDHRWARACDTADLHSFWTSVLESPAGNKVSYIDWCHIYRSPKSMLPAHFKLHMNNANAI